MKQIISLIVGIIIFIGSFAVLWINEGNNAKKIAIANYASKNAIQVDAQKINRENDGQLIATSAETISDAVLGDENINVSDTLIVSRKVEMYQWIENNEGGNTKYEKAWSEDFVDTSYFENKSYKNPSFPIKSEVFSANTAKFGNYTLNNNQILLIESENQITDLPQNPKYTIINGSYFSGKDIENPQIGDVLISYSYVPSKTAISIIGQQKEDNTISALPYKNTEIYIQYDGNLSKDDIIKAYKQDNSTFTIFIRIAGCLLMFLGLKLFISPIIDIFNLIPILGKIADLILSIVLFLISICLSLITIAIAWFAYRPILSVLIILVVFTITIAIKTIIDKNKQNVIS